MTDANDVPSKIASLPITLEQLAISFYRIWNICDVTSGVITSYACHMTCSMLAGAMHTGGPPKTRKIPPVTFFLLLIVMST